MSRLSIGSRMPLVIHPSPANTRVMHTLHQGELELGRNEKLSLAQNQSFQIHVDLIREKY